MFGSRKSVLPQPSLEEYLDASKTGNNYVVEKYLASRKNVDAKDPQSGKTALMLAAENGYLETVKMLLESGANPNARNFDKYTAVMYASQEGYVEIIKVLYNANADLNLITNLKRTALIIASIKGQADAVKTLCKLEANVNARDISYDTALHWAAYKGYAEVIEILIEAKANLELLNKFYRTPLIEAAITNKPEAAIALLKNGAKIHAQDNNINNYLHFAAQKGKVSVIETLLANGGVAFIEAKNEAGQTPLMEAVIQNKPEAAIVLLRNGAKINAQDNNINNSLHLAAYQGHIHVLETLLTNGGVTFIEAKNKAGQTPLMMAPHKGNCDAIKVLAKHRANLQASDNKNHTALHYAAYSGQANAVELLINLKVDMNPRDDYGDTPLLLALKQEKYAAAIVLIQSGCDISLRNKLGKTAKTINKNPEIAEMIANIENGIGSVHERLINLIQKQTVSKYNSDKTKAAQIKKFTDISSSMVLNILRNMQDNRRNVKKFDKLPSILNEISNLLYWMQIDCDENGKQLLNECATICKKTAVKIEEDNRKIIDIDDEKNTTVQSPLMLLSPGAPSKEEVLGTSTQPTKTPESNSSLALKY